MRRPHPGSSPYAEKYARWRRAYHQVEEIDVSSRVLAELAHAKMRSAKRARTWTPFAAIAAGGVAVSTLAMAVRLGFDAPNASARVVPARSERGGTATIAPKAFAPAAVVIGPDPLMTDGVGPLRLWTTGEVVPVGVALRTQAGQRAGVRLSDRAEVWLDPGAAIAIDSASPGSERVSLREGRIDVEVRSGERPVRLHLARAAVELSAIEATSGLLDGGDGRWAAVVRAGELFVHRPPPEEPLRVRAVGFVGAMPGQRASAGSPPARLDLEARLEAHGPGWVVQGLTDLLARVEVDGAPVPVDARGRFRWALDRPRSVVVSALDAAGRRLQREVHAPPPPAHPAPTSAGMPRAETRSAPNPNSAAPPRCPDPSAADPDPAPHDRRAIEIQPHSW